MTLTAVLAFIAIAAVTLMLHMAGLLALWRWHSRRAERSLSRSWYIDSCIVVLGITGLHIIGGGFFGAAYAALGAVPGVAEGLVAGISLHAGAFHGGELAGDGRTLAPFQSLVGLVAFGISLAFFIHMERTRPEGSAGRDSPQAW